MSCEEGVLRDALRGGEEVGGAVEAGPFVGGVAGDGYCVLFVFMFFFFWRWGEDLAEAVDGDEGGATEEVEVLGVVGVEVGGGAEEGEGVDRYCCAGGGGGGCGRGEGEGCGGWWGAVEGEGVGWGGWGHGGRLGWVWRGEWLVQAFGGGVESRLGCREGARGMIGSLDEDCDWDIEGLFGYRDASGVDCRKGWCHGHLA